MLAAGLIIERENDDRGPYDRFRERLMFPIRDTKGVSSVSAPAPLMTPNPNI